MKPKTRKETERDNGIERTTPSAHRSQMQWAFNNIIDHYAYRLKNGKRCVCRADTNGRQTRE